MTRTAEERAKGLEDLNFKVPADFKRAFRLVAVDKSLKLNELLFEVFREYIKQHRDALSVKIDPSCIPKRGQRE